MSASEILQALLDGMPDSYQKTVGYPTYDLLAAACGSHRKEGALAKQRKRRLRGGRTRGGALPPLVNHPRQRM